MVISLSGLFRSSTERQRRATYESVDLEMMRPSKRFRDNIADAGISRLPPEIDPPQGHLALVFTDIRNSTTLWETNQGMPTAMRIHNTLLRRQLRLCGGYEVKTEGDAFMCSFPTTLSALWWCLQVQVELLREDWPLAILDSEEGREITDSEGRIVARGLSVRMGTHVGVPVCERDPVTGRMDYFGPMVNRTARINGSAGGGEIMCSLDVLREIQARVLESGAETEYSWAQPHQAIAAIRQLGVTLIDKGSFQLKGLELPETLTLIYPTELAGRQQLSELSERPKPPEGARSRVRLLALIHQLYVIVVRLETLATGRIYKPFVQRKGSVVSTKDAADQHAELESLSPDLYLVAEENLLVPPIHDNATDAELEVILDSLATRVENALLSISVKHVQPAGAGQSILTALQRRGGINEQMLEQILAFLECSDGEEEEDTFTIEE